MSLGQICLFNPNTPMFSRANTKCYFPSLITSCYLLNQLRRSNLRKSSDGFSSKIDLPPQFVGNLLSHDWKLDLIIGHLSTSGNQL